MTYCQIFTKQRQNATISVKTLPRTIDQRQTTLPRNSRLVQPFFSTYIKRRRMQIIITNSNTFSRTQSLAFSQQNVKTNGSGNGSLSYLQFTSLISFSSSSSSSQTHLCLVSITITSQSSQYCCQIVSNPFHHPFFSGRCK